MAAGKGGGELPADAVVLGTIGGLAFLILAMLPAGPAQEAATALLILAAVAVVSLLAHRSGWLDGGAMVVLAVATAGLLLVLLAALPVSDAEAILLVGIITATGSLVEYRRRLEERRRAVAVALAAEIRVNAEATWLGLSPDVMATLAAKPAEFSPFVVPVPPQYPVYVGNQDTLGLLPPAAVRFVVSFYETDEFMTQAYNVLGTEGFHDLPRERQNQLYAHITERMRGEYLPVARRALEELAVAIGESPDLPGFLDEIDPA
ncbi:hypothetical protein [Elioraea rosea]|uniref:hypothetical protein n=1 Tax=Elioraea rosea TaxID=2492390 RepID=UPI0011820DC8|nr:hypothetical protein [Elioraea rosea]